MSDSALSPQDPVCRHPDHRQHPVVPAARSSVTAAAASAAATPRKIKPPTRPPTGRLSPPSLPPTHSQPFRHSVWHGCVSLLPFHRSVPLFPFCFHPIASRATIVRRNQSCLSPPSLLLPKTHRRIPPTHSQSQPESARGLETKRGHHPSRPKPGKNNAIDPPNQIYRTGFAGGWVACTGSGAC